MEKISLATIDSFAKKILELLAQKSDTAVLLALSGELGAGKTTFVQAFAKELGVEYIVQSPTYVLMKSYPIEHNSFTTLVHIDAYRLEKPEQFLALKPKTFLSDPKNIVCIEWPERIQGMLPKPDIVIHFSSEGMQEGERGMEVKKLV